MLTNTKMLFASILKDLSADCVCDIGSRDGAQSLLFRELLPNAIVVAFEANPINFQMMQANPALRSNRIEMHPFAVTNSNSVSKFHITDVDYSNPAENRGTSSLLVHAELKILRSVDVHTCRIDDFILKHHPQATSIGLWIDVEGVEYFVLEGISKIKDRVMAVHVETAKTPMRQGQKTFAELLPLMESYGFGLCGSNIGERDNWGDVVFLNGSTRQALRVRMGVCKAKAYCSKLVKIDSIAVCLKSRVPFLYHLLRRLYIKLWA